MNKKFLSAILFGALMVTSTGTFVSCKDYDDDIENLQGQISANTTAIAELKALLGDGNYVTSISVNGQNLVVNTKNGSTTVALPACKGGSLAEVKGGELFIDGEATGIKVAAGEAVKIEAGEWAILQADGSYKSTGIPASGVTVTGDEKNGYILTVTDAEGTATEIKMPTAASLITAIIPATTAPASIAVSNVEFTLDRTGNAITDASKWKGSKALPANGDHVYASASTVDVRINPLSVDATTVPFYLTNTKNADVQPIEMYAVAESEDDPLKTTNGRAANLGNGLYTLKVNTVVVKKADNNATNGVQTLFDKTVADGYALAINANHSARSPYQFTVVSADASRLTSVKLAQGNLVSSEYTIGTTNTSTQKTYKVGKAIEVKATEAAALYDMYLEADASDVEVFDLTFDQAKHTVTIGKNPDVSSVQAFFTLYVTTVANNGEAKKTTIKVNLDPEMSASEYELITHDVSAENNFFGIDLSTMKTALGNDLAAWTQNVDLTAANIEKNLYANKACTTDAGETDVFTYDLVKELKKDAAVTSNRNEANYIRVSVNNAKVNGKLKLNTTYYIKLSFKNNSAKVLSSIVVPVKFTAPALSTFFTQRDAFVQDGVINAYFYKANGVKTVDLTEYYSKYVEDATLDYDNTAKVGETDKYTSQLATGASTYNTDGTFNVYCKFTNPIGLNAALKKAAPNAQFELGYNEVLTFKATKDNYQGWKYTEASEKTYAFKVRIMSSIIEGSIAPATGSAIEVSASDATVGAKITSAMIKGADYNKNEYDVVPDMVGAVTTDVWSNTFVNMVTVSVGTSGYLLSATVEAATEDATVANKVAEKGYILIKAKSISQTTTVEMPVTVTDAWGYTKTQNVPVTIKMN